MTLYKTITRAKIGDVIDTPNGRGVVFPANGRNCEGCRCYDGDPDIWRCLARSDNPNSYPACSKRERADKREVVII